MRLGTLSCAGLAAGVLIALGVGAQMWPPPTFAPPVRVILPMPEDLCSARREGACLEPGFGAEELVALYRLPRESADRISVGPDGSIRFDADRVGAER